MARRKRVITRVLFFMPSPPEPYQMTQVKR